MVLGSVGLCSQSCHYTILVRIVELEADADYAEAVQWCLQSAPTYAWSGGWQEELVQCVVRSLEKCYQNMTLKKVPYRECEGFSAAGSFL